jgi:hypothetical protein
MKRLIFLFALASANPAQACDTSSWSFTDATRRVVVCINMNGSIESELASDSEIQLWVAGGNSIGAAPSALIASMQLISTSTPALNATYAIDPDTQQKVQSVSLYIAVNGRFPTGQTTQAWPDVNGTIHQFQTTAQWQAFAAAMGHFVAALDLGQTPAQPVSIP